MSCRAAVIEPIVIPPDAPEPTEQTSSQMIIDVDVVTPHPLAAWFQKFIVDRFRRFFPLVLLAACFLASSAMYHYHYELPATLPTENIAYVQRIQSEEITHGTPVTIKTDGALSVDGVLWRNEGHVISRYSQLKGASEISLQSSSIDSPLSIYAIDEDLDIVILKHDSGKHATGSGVSEQPEKRVFDQETVLDKNTTPLRGTSVAQDGSSVLSEILKGVSVKKIDNLIKFGTKPT